MRKLLTGIAPSMACAVLITGSALAAGMTSSDHRQQVTANVALQSQLERDTSLSGEPWTHQSPLGQVVAPANAMRSSSGHDGAAARMVEQSSMSDKR